MPKYLEMEETKQTLVEHEDQHLIYMATRREKETFSPPPLVPKWLVRLCTDQQRIIRNVDIMNTSCARPANQSLCLSRLALSTGKML